MNAHTSLYRWHFNFNKYLLYFSLSRLHSIHFVHFKLFQFIILQSTENSNFFLIKFAWEYHTQFTSISPTAENIFIILLNYIFLFHRTKWKTCSWHHFHFTGNSYLNSRGQRKTTIIASSFCSFVQNNFYLHLKIFFFFYFIFFSSNFYSLIFTPRFSLIFSVLSHSQDWNLSIWAMNTDVSRSKVTGLNDRIRSRTRTAKKTVIFEWIIFLRKLTIKSP